MEQQAMTFDEWWAAMAAASTKTGLPYNGGDPEAYRASYDEGMSPEEALVEDASYGE